jgi:hypothetical protein
VTDALFVLEDGLYVPTDRAGSPWSDTTVHGGPPAGLLARGVEQFAASEEMHVARLTIDLFRPVPKQPLELAARTVREGKRIHVVESSLLAGGVEVCRAVGLLLRRQETGHPGGVDMSLMPPGPDGIETASLAGRPDPVRPVRDGFHRQIEVRWVARPGESGPAVAWLRTPVAMVQGEEWTPLERLAALSDFVNPLSGSGARGTVGFINVDSSIHIHRQPRGEWIGMRVERAVEPYGIGVAHAILFDAEGPVGRCTQTALANQMR